MRGGQDRGAASEGMSLWAQGFGAFGDFNGDGNAAPLSRDISGVVAGLDDGFGDWRLGVAAGYSHANADTMQRGGAAHIESWHAAAYAGGRDGDWRWRGGAA